LIGVCALLGHTQALAVVIVPIVARFTLFRTANAGTRLFVPSVARSTHLRPFADAPALLPVPVLVIWADKRHIALALARNRVPYLTFGALVELWADAGALLKAEVAGLQALNSLFAFTSAGEWVPVPRMDAFRLR
jgi:hypothetical protein